MSDVRYYEETDCEECGVCHSTVRHGRHDRVLDREYNGNPILCVGSGGSRREITLNMTAVIDYLIEEFSITDMVDRDTLLAYAYDMELAALREPDPPASKKE